MREFITREQMNSSDPELSANASRIIAEAYEGRYFSEEVGEALGVFVKDMINNPLADNPRTFAGAEIISTEYGLLYEKLDTRPESKEF